ncbi:uncharacterized protein RHOBADRAFT_39171 [Rhodotorula graminis WP1]|uniref:Uncharacterized protein n=1 Tax=Rhodotorula graminis (strain WP1) TaxID=578459 RepID=A0A0N8PZK6_RHOGW|nr:uncharacterized protein RHOBADRAFT_39171 [Rhodotorula graminis WP1]KPV72589.1 hypothetical protein RHOBADRAFT_39171 [Rhodotorula graminis WP1]
MTPPARLAQVQAHLASPTSSPPPPARSASSSSATQPAKPSRPRAPTANEFRYFLPMQTRWNDNDSYGHMNNAIYSHYFDSVTNAYLLHHAYPSPPAPRPIGLIVNSATTYAASVAYPQPVVAALAVSHLGTRSVTWRVALFAAEYGDDEPRAAAYGEMVHVFVDQDSRRPVKELDDGMRAALQKLVVQ